MPRFRIEQRAPGDPMQGEVSWETFGTLEAGSADAALQDFFDRNGWHTSYAHRGTGLVHGVGHFRAMPEHVEPAHHFMIQRQEPVAGDERHRVWSDLAIVQAPTEYAALSAYIEHMRWSIEARHEHSAVIAGLGLVRAVPADRADDYRVSPAPRGNRWT